MGFDMEAVRLPQSIEADSFYKDKLFRRVEAARVAARWKIEAERSSRSDVNQQTAKALFTFTASTASSASSSAGAEFAQHSPQIPPTRCQAWEWHAGGKSA